jgi:ubiquinone/menaquinone biosynthesis C-methylase UbiE
MLVRLRELTAAEELQRRYYTDTASEYDSMHESNCGEHGLALGFLRTMMDHYGWKSVLDVGSGTGRAVKDLLGSRPGLHVIGVEPVAALREVGPRAGVPETNLIDGDATALTWPDASFDCDCAFGVLHHMEKPKNTSRDGTGYPSRSLRVRL